MRETVEAALKARLNRVDSEQTPQKEEILGLERDLREAAGKIESARDFCLRACDQIRTLTRRALDEATNALLAVWTGAAADGAEPGTAVTMAIARTAGLAAQVHTHLQEVAHSLAQALQRAAESLGNGDAPAEEELAHPLREMPRFDPPPVRLNLHRPWILYPRALLRARIGRNLRSSLERPLTEAFATHGRLVENWTRKALAELQARFDSSADAYRAQLARLIGHGVLTTEEQRSIFDDLARLSEAGGSEGVPAETVTAESLWTRGNTSFPSA